MPKNLDQLRKGKEFISHAEKKERRFDREKDLIQSLNIIMSLLLFLCIMRTWEKASDIRL